MVNICFYFQVHQPIRLRKYTIFDIGQKSDYFDEKKNKEIFEKVSKKCYKPMTKLLIELIKNNKQFKVSFSFTGIFLEQALRYDPELVRLFKKLITHGTKTGQVEVLAETYYHSLSFIKDKDEFIEQIKLHNKIIRNIFNVNPKIFRNTELIFRNDIAKIIEDLGFKAILAEGADAILNGKSPNSVYQAFGTKLPILLKNYKLSDDIAFRFGDKKWKEYPLTPEKYAKWINSIKGETINLFMDYETFGEHQWADTGIFRFMKQFPKEFLKNKNNRFVTPSQVIEKYQAREILSFEEYVSWADIERDISAWLSNNMQKDALNKIFEIKDEIKKNNNLQLLADWRKLTTSDHFYYMCTKWFNDGDVHKYFNPYDSPYECYISFMNVFNDIKLRLLKSKKLNVNKRNIIKLEYSFLKKKLENNKI